MVRSPKRAGRADRADWADRADRADRASRAGRAGRAVPVVLTALAALASATLLAGCAVGPDYARRDPAVPAAFVSAAPEQAREPEEAARWWELLGDPVLGELMARAESGSLDLRAAEARVRQARALRGEAVAGYFPEGGPSASYTRFRSSQATTSVGGAGGTGGAGGFSPGKDASLYKAGLDASWELDVFGGVRRGVEAADAELAASEYGLGDALVSLRGEVALAYLDLAAARRRLAVAEEDLAAREDSERLVRARFDAGLATALDLARAEGAREAAAAVPPPLRQAAAGAEFRLAVLAGEAPGALHELLARVPARLPEVPAAPASGVPSDLLRRRPDIRRAERLLAAGNARIGVAEAELYPRFSLTGSFGWQGQDPGDIASERASFWSIGPALSWNILNFRRILAGVDAAGASRDEAEAAYHQSVLTALEEVENALTALGEQKTRESYLSRAVEADRRAASLAEDRYASGLESYLAVLDALSALYRAEDELAGSRQELAAAFVRLYKALGGGWETRPEGEPAS